MNGLPIWAILVDYGLGMIMWTLIARSAMNIFLPINSDFFFMKIFVKSTQPILNIFSPITQSFLLEAIVPIYVAWFFFMVRFYVLPGILGYSVMGMLSFPLEGEIAAIIYKAFN